MKGRLDIMEFRSTDRNYTRY